LLLRHSPEVDNPHASTFALSPRWPTHFTKATAAWNDWPQVRALYESYRQLMVLVVWKEHLNLSGEDGSFDDDHGYVETVL